MRALNAKGLLYSLGFVLLVACSDNADTLQALDADATLLAFGDSLTFGTGATPEEAYPSVLQSLSNRTVINAGIPGEVSADALDRLPGVLERVKPDVLLLCHGGNDLLRKLDPRETEANLLAMIRLAQARGVDVVLIGVPKPGLLFLAPHELYDRVAKNSGATYLPDILPELESTPAMKSDAIHLNAAGYRALAEAIRLRLVQSGALPQ